MFTVIDKIMNPNSPYNDSYLFRLKIWESLPVLENVDEISIASVDGDLREKILSCLRYLIQHFMIVV